MLALTLLASQADTTGPAAPPEEIANEIVVIARKLEVTKFKFDVSKAEDGSFLIKSCHVTRSSGDREIDAITCRAAQECVSKFVETAERTLATEGFAACGHERRTALVAELAERRAARRES